MLRDYHPEKLIVFSRDELKQSEMRMAGFDHPSLRYFIGVQKVIALSSDKVVEPVNIYYVVGY